jgi:hypothetical protein
MDLKGNLAYQLAAAFLSDVMNDLVRVVRLHHTKLLPLHTTSKTFADLILRSILVEVLQLYIGLD